MIAVRIAPQPPRSSAPSPVGSLLRTSSPSTCGLLPTQIGTVSMCADNSVRGPDPLPGKRHNQVATVSVDPRSRLGTVKNDG